ncbi:MAG: Coq4 family protein [Pseudomonadota bacterium]
MQTALDPVQSSWLARARLAIRRARQGEPGDFALLKADLLGAYAAPALAPKLEGVRGYRPSIDLQTLSTYPADSFGRAYADWMVGRGLTPIVVSEDLSKIAERNTFALRYAITHDMVHVLTGFDTSLAGEIGVLAFATAQGYTPAQRVGLFFASLLYPLAKPWGIGGIWRAKAKGRRMGEAAVFLLGERLEDRFAEPLDKVRRDLSIVV